MTDQHRSYDVTRENAKWTHVRDNEVPMLMSLNVNDLLNIRKTGFFLRTLERRRLQIKHLSRWANLKQVIRTIILYDYVKNHKTVFLLFLSPRLDYTDFQNAQNEWMKILPWISFFVFFWLR